MIPVACKGCEREGHQLRDCNIRIVKFNTYNLKCPRERALAQAITPEVKPQLLKTTKEPSSDILTTNLRLEDVALGVFTPRMAMNQKWVKELAEDIKRNGQQKAIIVQYQPEPPYPVVDGEHRICALKLLKQTLVRAEIKPLSDEEAAFLAMKINEMHGLRLDPLEEGNQMYLLQEKWGWSQERLAERYSRSRHWVSQRINLYLRASPELKSSIATRVAMFSQAREIIELPKEEQPEVVEKVKEARLGARKTKALVKALKTVETPVEKQLVLEKVPKLDAKQAEALTDVLQDKPVEERIEILEKPIESYKELYKEPEALGRALAAKPEEAVFQVLTCPVCGNKVAVDWNSREFKWEGEAKER